MAKGKKREVKIVIAAKDRYSKPLTAAGRKFKAFGLAMGRFVKVGALAATAALAGLVAVMYKAVLMSGEFGKGMAEISTLSNEVAGNIGMYADALIRLSGETGAPLEILTKTLYDMISAGTAASDSLRFLDVASRLAVAGVAEASETIDLLTSILGAYNLAASDAAMISDQLFTTVKLGKTTISDLASSVGKVAPLMKAAGASTEEMFAAIADLTIPLGSATEAVTGLKGVVRALGKPSKEMTAVLNNAGFATGQAAIEARGFGGVLDILSEATGGSINKMLKLIPRIEGANAALILAQGGAEGFKNNLADLLDVTGATDEAYEKMADTWDFRTKRLGANVKTLAVSIGELITKNSFFNTIVDEGSTIFSKWTWYVRNNKAALMQLAKEGLLSVIEGIGGVLRVMQPLQNAWLGLKLVGTTALAVIVNAISKTYDTLLLFLSPLKRVFDGFVQLGLIKVNPFSFTQEKLATFAESSAEVARSVTADILEINNGYDETFRKIDAVTNKLKGFAATEFVPPGEPQRDELAVKREQKAAIENIETQHQATVTAITVKGLTDQRRLEARNAKAIVTMRYGVVRQTIALGRALAGDSKAAAIAVIAVEKGLAIAQTIMNTQVAAMRAFAELGPILGAPAAAAIRTMGNISVGLIAATGLAEAGSVGGGGASVGSYANPAYTSSSPSSALLTGADNQRPVQDITIIIQNPLNGEIGQDAAETIIKAITETGDERDIKINYMAA